jgi:hypothetical protein
MARSKTYNFNFELERWREHLNVNIFEKIS